MLCRPGWPGSGDALPPKRARRSLSPRLISFFWHLKVAKKIFKNRYGACDARSLVEQDVRPRLKTGDVPGEDHNKRSAVLVRDGVDQFQSALAQQADIQHHHVWSMETDLATG